MAKNVVIIGGGASGLMAAIWASRLGAAVTVLEKNDKPGRKLLATGNGRCNFTNRYQDASCYRTGNQERASRVLEQFTEQDTEQFFEQLGIRIRSREGWLYPASEQAQSVLEQRHHLLRKLCFPDRRFRRRYTSICRSASARFDSVFPGPLPAPLQRKPVFLLGGCSGAREDYASG